MPLLTKEQQDAVNALIGNKELDSKNGSSSIAKYLFEDFLFLLNVSMMRLICSKMEDADKYFDGIIEVWKKRVSGILASETKKFQDALFRSIQSSENIDENFQRKMNDYFSKYCIIRDNAVEEATKAVNNVKEQVLRKESRNHDEH